MRVIGGLKCLVNVSRQFAVTRCSFFLFEGDLFTLKVTPDTWCEFFIKCHDGSLSVDLSQLGCTELYFSSTDVLLEVRETGSAGNRQHDGRAMKQPSERELRNRHSIPQVSMGISFHFPDVILALGH